jgi:hypothetical protein
MFRSILLSLLSALCWIQDEMCMCGHTAATTRATGSPPSPQRYAPPSRLPPAGSTGPAGVVARGGDGRWAPQQSVALQPEGAASGGGQLAHRYVSRLWCQRRPREGTAPSSANHSPSAPAHSQRGAVAVAAAVAQPAPVPEPSPRCRSSQRVLLRIRNIPASGHARPPSPSAPRPAQGSRSGV